MASFPTIWGVIGFILLACALGLLGRWAYHDGERRGKPGWLIVLLVFSDAGLIAWLALRPDVRS